ncbi:hypothetical protein GCM10023205_47550 [Yinghuangia aomiensis]|uniref:Pyrrolo-quinoline quinone repeat domain-containing protein n=1 Tax=Yinghuangia aomiensis TaxID=676205 RepID=A0ABP9HPR6_9ACTN
MPDTPPRPTTPPPPSRPPVPPPATAPYPAAYPPPYPAPPPNGPWSGSGPGFGPGSGSGPGPGPGFGPGPASGGRSRRLPAVVAGVVVLVLLAGAGAWFAFGGSDDGDSDAPASAASGASPGPGGSKAAPKSDLVQAWTAAAPGRSDSARGGWVVGAKVYTVLESGIAVREVAGGAETGKVALPAAAGKICAAAARPVGNVGLVGWEGASGDCDNVSALDLDAGTVLWSAVLTESSGAWEMALSGFGDQAVAGAGGYVYAFDLRSGTVKWKYKSQDDGGVYGSWDIRDVLASPTQIAVTVQKMDQKTKYIGGVVVLDPATGTARAKTQLANGPDSWPSLLAADPVVVFDEWNATGILGKKAGVIAVYDGALKPGARFEVGEEDEIVFDKSSMLDGLNEYDGSVVVRDGVLYTGLGSAQDVRSVGAFDLATGKRLWSSSTKVSGYPMPLSADDSGVLVLVGEDHGGTEAHVQRFAKADGTVTTVHTLRAKPAAAGAPTAASRNAYPDKDDEVEIDLGGITYVADGRVVMLSGSSSQPLVRVFA